MNKSAFLDAMKITRWRVADNTVKPYLVLHDGDIPDTSLVTSILDLLGVGIHACRFSNKPIRGVEVVWDMRAHKTRPRVAWVSSSSLSDLQSSSQEKRQLWRQIIDHLEKQSLDS